MDRRESIKTLLLGTVSLPLLKKGPGSYPPDAEKAPSGSLRQQRSPMRSRWERWPDIEWTGPAFWGNRLQDWQVRNGKAACSVSDVNRTLHLLTHRLDTGTESFKCSVKLEVLHRTGSEADYLGFRLGARGVFDDYRSAAVFGEGLDAGVTANGTLFIGNKRADNPIGIDGPLLLEVEGRPTTNGDHYEVILTARNPSDMTVTDRLRSGVISGDAPAGNVALVSHYELEEPNTQRTSALFADWRLVGKKVTYYPGRTYGPICFAQYTLDRGILNMTAQLAPVERISGHYAELQIREGELWQTLQDSRADPLSRTAHFRVENWGRRNAVPYRIRLVLPLADGRTESFDYEGTIAAEPVDSSKLKAAVFSCNSDYGFPNTEVVTHVAVHKPDLAVFLGDQIYESHGGFGIQRAPLDKACLDFLHKWYMFGWSYREIFRDIPCAFIPDDHDVYHGNIWGEAGKDAPTERGWGYEAQDAGGYKMPPKWVNMVQRAQTSHLPDPYDPTPVRQDIGVYYTDWNYGGVSFAIIEDRKFKTAPKNVLPEEAKVVNGFIQNRNFEIKNYYDIDADLLGDRQLSFLEQWTADWSGGVRMKAVLSQTNFCTLATLPEGSIIDRIVPKLEIPERGEYVDGDAPTTDMDSNGWPQRGRDEALRTIRKGFAFHIAGDQHLASVVHYGVEDYGDAGFSFAGPALNNIWPRRWWPPVGGGHRPLPGRARYTGNFEDGFGNKMTVYAVANPVQTDREPAIIYDRATGYGMVTFDKSERTVTVECWPRYADPRSNPGGQYDGWPVIIRQEENYGRRAVAYLPEIIVEGMEQPVVELYNRSTGELVYALRIEGRTFRAKVFDAGPHRVRVGDPDRGRWKERDRVVPGETEPVTFTFNE